MEFPANKLVSKNRRKRIKGLKIFGQVVIFVVIAIVFVAYVFPIFWMGTTSLKTKKRLPTSG